MAHPYGTDSDEIDFSRPIPLLPRHGVCVFPGTLEALHIGNPRYVNLIDRTLHGARLLAVGVMDRGWEKYDETSAPVLDVVCLCRVAAHCPLADGSLNLMLRGLRRGRIVETMLDDEGRRSVLLEPLPDRLPTRDEPFDAEAARRRLLIVFHRLIAGCSSADEALDEVMGSRIPLGRLTDTIAHTVPLERDHQVELLAETDVRRRAEILLQWLQQWSIQPGRPVAYTDLDPGEN